MDRDTMIGRLSKQTDVWDLIIIGGGATGLGCAVDAASRGYKTLLLERGDFAKGTSSRSTKLVHGGVRYLQQGNFSLVLEALKERGILRQNAPHLVSDLPLVVPNYDWWEAPWTGIGLKIYDLMAGKLGFGKSKILSLEETVSMIPTIEQQGLHGGIVYHDGQFDDARLAINLARTAVNQGATVINYMNVTALHKTQGIIDGLTVQDLESNRDHNLRCKAVINATGAFCDAVREMDEPGIQSLIVPSQGVHLMLPGSFLPGKTAILVPHTHDGRVIFLIPWHDCVMVGTTDTPIDEISIEPQPLPEEIDFLLEYAAQYLDHDPTRKDVLSVFAGIRPLVGNSQEGDTANLSRDHCIVISHSGLMTVAGGKWTTYRKMAEDAIDQIQILAELNSKPCVTENLRIHGFHHHANEFGNLAWYGADANNVRTLIAENAEYQQQIHPALPTIAAEVIWAARKEMARSVEDFLARRSRALLLNARASVEMAPKVAELMAAELGRDAAWQTAQIEEYTALADGYILN